MEAAIVLPMVFFVMAALLIVAFYVHDRAVLQAIVCEGASSGSNFITEEERNSAAVQVSRQIIKERFLGCRNLSGSAMAGKDKVCLEWNGTYPVPGMVGAYFFARHLQVQVSWTNKIDQPAETIRKIRGAGEFLTRKNE